MTSSVKGRGRDGWLVEKQTEVLITVGSRGGDGVAGLVEKHTKVLITVGSRGGGGDSESCT